ncbi:MAG: thioesterase [Thermodesulfobacteriota bacterium]|nr:thioesterase [Thermodesulfobacteriota bacterium]
MGFELTREIDYFQTAPDSRVRLDSFVRILQDAAISHVHSAALSPLSDKTLRGGPNTPNVLIAEGYAWILNKLAVEIRHRPVYGELVTVRTWHRGRKGFKSFREYEVICNGEQVAVAASSWLYLDLNRRRVVRVPEATDDLYGIEPEFALDWDIEAWKPNKKLMPDFEIAITTRRSDYDMLEHVNNAVYFDYLDTLVERATGGGGAIKRVAIQYNKEIGRHVTGLNAGLSIGNAAGRAFVIQGADGVYACGNIGLEF